MRKLLFITGFLLILVGCREQHVYHTYYGDINIDTLEAVEAWGDPNWYPVVTTMLEDTISHAMGLDSMWEVIYYSPAQDLYFQQIFGSDGRKSGRFTFSPNPEKEQTMRDYYSKRKGGK